MKTFVYMVTAVLIAILPLKAETQPHPSSGDGRIKQLIYTETEVYKLDLYLKIITSVQFASGEAIRSILVGDSASWEIIRLQSGNVLSVKPIVADANTNMTIYTDRRVYTFHLKSMGEAANALKDNAQNFRVVFKYPKEEAEQKKAAAEAKHSKSKMANLNFGYYVAGRGRFRPVEIYDNGRQTFFRFPPNAPKPAIFKVGHKGKESLINVRTKGDTIIADSISNLWTVRIGNEELCIAASAFIKGS
ncbi:TrbG/VirB9 family P-type conjugative transfer protein [uncultured Roseibium sp.]|uniref:TrbG/VirB9 family P-type conjugative transfer protein n=1 Tax=uncultured Roseibium sp. TaxID=1936171 RepID=UPI002609FD53|nr:TrbG/VirB9 family P-type conjugative transfer protein [uncultured Roseibium sp.]